MCLWLIWEVVNLVDMEVVNLVKCFSFPSFFFLFPPPKSLAMVWNKPKLENTDTLKMFWEGYRTGVPVTSGLKTCPSSKMNNTGSGIIGLFLNFIGSSFTYVSSGHIKCFKA